MTAEQQARQRIDARLRQAGCAVQDWRALDLGTARGVAVRELPTDTGPADYVLYVDRHPLGVIEAKRDEAAENITVVEAQTERYAHAALKWRRQGEPLPFLFEATGQLIRFTDAGGGMSTSITPPELGLSTPEPAALTPEFLPFDPS